VIDELDAFLRAKENQEAASLLLSQTDYLILAAVVHFDSGRGFHTPPLGAKKGYETRDQFLGRTTYPAACGGVVDSGRGFHTPPLGTEKGHETQDQFLGRTTNPAASSGVGGSCDFNVIKAALSGLVPIPALHEGVLNLEERLFLYQPRNKFWGKPGSPAQLAVTPAFEQMVRKKTSLSLLFPPAPPVSVVSRRSVSPGLGASLPVTSAFLAAFLAFAAANRDLCKAGGAIKKRVAARFFKVFPEILPRVPPGGENSEILEILNTLIAACEKFGLLRRVKTGDVTQWDCDFAAWDRFALFPHEQRLALLTATSCRDLRPSLIGDMAWFILNFIRLLPETGFTESVLIKAELFFFEQYFSAPEKKKIRFFTPFSDIMEILEDSVHFAVAYGLLEVLVPRLAGEELVYRRSGAIFPEEDSPGISVDAAHTVTVLPTVPLTGMIRLARFADLERFDTVARYQITKNSCVRGFDLGYTPQEIIGELQSLCSHDLPRNLSVTLADWYQTYSSATLYRGYVLRITDEHVRRILQNPAVAAHIAAEIAPGVYLLRGENEAELRNLLEKQLGRDLGQIRISAAEDSQDSGAKHGVFLRNISFAESRPPGIVFSGASVPVVDKNASKAFLDSLMAKLDSLALPREQHNEMSMRIRRRIIINPAQLNSASVLYEKTEAGCMDFQGKMRLLEFAVNNHTLVALRTGTGGAQEANVIGYPLSLKKRARDILLIIRTEPGNCLQSYSVGQLQAVRKVRVSFFTGLPYL
ncbi:MAG: helicase-associated domain-containing protein, partial [Spirochaetaceae bacterium]|jgi:hypothetical protein|nr:helicase-associated domain-containing protein [Spirochaetaceae bacterium]